jgi:hypothetical protein
MRQADTLECPINAGFGYPEHPCGEDEVFGRRQVLVEPRGVRHQPDVPANRHSFADEVMTVNPSFSNGGAKGGRDHSQQRALPAPVMSKDADYFARLDFEGDGPQRPPGSETA